MRQNSNIALEKLRALICEYKAAGKTGLPTQSGMAKMFGVGLRAVRRAVNVLELEGVITVRQGSGVYIGSLPVSFSPRNIPEFKTIKEVMEVRLCIEPYICRLAAENINSDNIRRMNIAETELSKDKKDTDFSELWDGTFHREIAVAANNRLLLEVFDQINLIRQSEKWRNVRASLRSVENNQENRRDHKRILNALVARDNKTAEAAMYAHLNRLLQILIDQE